MNKEAHYFEKLSLSNKIEVLRHFADYIAQLDISGIRHFLYFYDDAFIELRQRLEESPFSLGCNVLESDELLKYCDLVDLDQLMG
ncbi:hypothetical protein V6R21_13780 [Limibacter armeniacum]|uniref:hypothetical protein n=1 Tax=Limibacter armeniacum TaxID=466084 RepID=UPI002FE5E501